MACWGHAGERPKEAIESSQRFLTRTQGRDRSTLIASRSLAAAYGDRIPLLSHLGTSRVRSIVVLSPLGC